MMLLLLLLMTGYCLALPAQDVTETDTEHSRKVLGSSVVTSVSVILDTGNGSQAYFIDAIGKPVAKPSAAGQLASPINLLNPDRYEFFTFDDNGELVKRLMTLEEIQAIIANGEGDVSGQLDAEPEKRVNDIVNNVQNVLKEEIQLHKPGNKPILDTPDVSASWNMILPSIFGNTGEDIKPNIKPSNTALEPETITFITEAPLPTSTKFIESDTTSEQTTKQDFVTFYSVDGNRPNFITSEKTVTSFDKKGMQNKVPTQAKYTTTETSITTVSGLQGLDTVFMINTTPAVYNNPATLTTELTTVLDKENFTSQEPSTTNTQSLIKQQEEKTTKPTITVSTTSEMSVSKVTSFTAAAHTNPANVTVKHTQTTVLSDIESEKDTSTIETSTANIKVTIPLNISLEPSQSTTSEQSTTKMPTTPIISNENLTTVKQSTELPSESNQESTEVLKTSASENIKPFSSTVNYRPIIYLLTTPENNPSQHTTSTKSDVTSFGLTPTTEYISESPISTTNSDLDIKYKSTTENLQEKTNDIPTTTQFTTEEKPEVSEILNQLLESTDIYEINSELSNTSPKLTTTESPKSTDQSAENFVSQSKETSEDTTKENLDEAESTNTIQATGTTKSPELLTEPNTKEIEDVTLSTTSYDDKINSTSVDNLQTILESNKESTTEMNIVSSIDEIISQMNQTTITETIKTNNNDSEKVFYVIFNTSLKPMKQVQTESATAASILFDPLSENDLLVNALSNNIVSTTIGGELLTTTEEQLNNTTRIDVPQNTPKVDLSVVNTNKTTNYKSNEESSNVTEPSITSINLHNKFMDDSTENRLTSGSFTLENSPTTTALPTTSASSTIYPSTIASNVYENNTLIVESKNTLIDILTTITPLPSTTSPFTTIRMAPTENSQNKIEDNLDSSTWALIPMISPNSTQNPIEFEDKKPKIPHIEPSKPVDLIPQQGFGLEDSTAHLDTDVYKFVELCNELAFGFWQSVTTGISTARSVFTSPFAATSLLAMVFLGARGSTSGEMNEILKLDDMVTFNPHLIFRNVSESIDVSPKNGIATSAIIRELYSDKSKGKLLSFYKERARQFYDGHVEEVSFREIGDIIRRRTNLLVKRHTWGKISEFIKDMQITARPPLAGISATIFQTDCSSASTDGRDGELYFVVLPSVRQRRLVPVPAVVYKSEFLAGYDPGLDATAVALGSKDLTVSTIFVIPGQQGIAAPGDGLARLEKHLTDTAIKKGSWKRLMKTLIPRPGLEIQIPRFSHRSIINATVALQKMGLKDLFDSKKADLRGLNGVAHELHLSDLLQVNIFTTCGEGPIENAHHAEIYPATALRPSRQSKKLELALELQSEFMEEPRDYQRAFHDPLHNPSHLALPLSLRPRQARLPEVPRLKFDRPFLYFVRHNPTGLILHMGRFNPRLLP